MKKSSPPPPPSPPLVFPEKAMNALMYKLCDDTVSSSILYGINRLNQYNLTSILENTITNIHRFTIEIKILIQSATALRDVKLDHIHVLEEKETEKRHSDALKVRDQKLLNYSIWLNHEKNHEKNRMLHFHPPKINRCNIKCRRKLRSHIVELAKHVGDMIKRKNQQTYGGTIIAKKI